MMSSSCLGVGATTLYYYYDYDYYATTTLTTTQSSCRRKSKSKSKVVLLCHSSSSSSYSYETKSSKKQFRYSRASPSVRYPHLNLNLSNTNNNNNNTTTINPHFTVIEKLQHHPLITTHHNEKEEEEEEIFDPPISDQQMSNKSPFLVEKTPPLLNNSSSRNRAKKMTKLALKRAKDWRQRVGLITDKILSLGPDEFVADVLDNKQTGVVVQMTPTDYCYVVKWVGNASWQRSLEVYEWLNLRRWYTPNPRMLAIILSVLGKANQEALAAEIFDRAHHGVGNTVQVYNAMMGVYARNGRFSRVQEMLNLMRERGCEPDLVSFNTLINARLRSAGKTVPSGLAIELLGEVRRSGLRPDIITYNTLISACARESNLEEAVKVYDDMVESGCWPDLWTYNSMISVYGRCGLPSKAEGLFRELGSKGFLPDAVTYNSLLFAFAREGSDEKAMEIFEEMEKMGFEKDEMSYNTIIDMYGKNGRNDMALRVYEEMKNSGRRPDVVTYTVLIDSLGKANMTAEASELMSEMLSLGVKPTLKTYTALICGYAKAGKRVEADETFNCMIKSGIKADYQAYSVMLDIHLRSSEIKKATSLYHEMVCSGFSPDRPLHEALFHELKRAKKEEDINKVIKNMNRNPNFDPQVISSILVKGECYDHAGKLLKKAIADGCDLDHGNLLSILSAYSSAGGYKEALDLVDFVRENVPKSYQIVTEAAVVIHCKAQQIKLALNEYYETWRLSNYRGSPSMYESLITSCDENELYAEASQVLSDMRFNGAEPTYDLYKTMVQIYCKMGYPETAHHLVDLAEARGEHFDDVVIYVSLIEAYGKLKILERGESLVGILRQRVSVVDRKVWNALIHAYATHGCYEKARAAFNTMMRDGPSPSVETVNFLMQALINDERLEELYVVIQELQDMGFIISKSTILLMLDAFARVGNIFEVKKIYNGMKASGYYPSMHLYRVMIELFAKGKRVRDVEAMVSEMELAGFEPDIFIFNCLLKLYAEIEEFKKTMRIYRQIKEAGLKPDEDTYNTLILMYCRDRRPEEGLHLLNEMKGLGLDPKLDTYKSLVSAFGKLQIVEKAEELFEGLRSKGYKLDRSFYHIMMKTYRTCGDHSRSEKLLEMMKEAGIEPTIATMHMLMISYGSSGQPNEAEEVLNNLKTTSSDLALPYSSVIDAYLKNGEYSTAIQKLKLMSEEGLEPDHRIWTYFIRAASLSRGRNEATILLNAIKEYGFDLPLRFLTEKSESLISDVDQYLEKLKPIKDNAALNFVNAIEDLLWAFELRATASLVFQLAIKQSIYRHEVFRVAEKDWGADFRKLSAGAALVGLTLWLDHMQDASLEGFPESPKSVVLITGASEYNNVSLNSTLKACLWEMGSPFLPCKTRSGLLIAKSHSLRMWLKDSPFCLDLELRDGPHLPELNSMRLIEGCFIRRGLVNAFKDINEKLGQVRPKKFARLALLTDERRSAVIKADIDGRAEKLAKFKRKGLPVRKKVKRIRTGKFIRTRSER